MIARSTAGIRSAGKEAESRQRHLDLTLEMRDISLAAPKNKTVDVEVEGQNMLGSASRLRDALWSWTKEHAGIARQPATPDRNSGRTVVRTTLVAALTSSVYVAFGTVVWSAYGQFGLQSLRDVTPLVKARAAFVKLAPPHLTVRASEADRPPVVATFELSVEEELPSQLSTALLRDGAEDPPAPPSLSLPARARSAARAARPLVAPEEARPERTFARAEARLEARSRPGAGSLLGGPRGRADLPSTAGSREELDARPRGIGSRAQPPSSTTAIAASAPGEPGEPGLTRPAAPKPSFKPRDVAVAWAAMERTSSSPVGGRDAAARPGSGPGSRAAATPGSRTPPLRPAFKPLDGARVLASGEPSRVAYAEGRSVLGSFWSRVRALFEPAPRRLIVAGNGSSRDAGTGRSGFGGAADAPGRSGGDRPDQSAGGGSTGGSAGGSSTAGSSGGSNTASRGSTNSGSPSSNTGSGSVAGGVTGSVAGGVAGSVGGSVGASVGGRSVGASVGGSGNQGHGRSGGRGGDDDDDGGSGGGKGGGGKGGGGKGGGGKGGDGKGGGGGGKGGGKGGGGDDD